MKYEITIMCETETDLKNTVKRLTYNPNHKLQKNDIKITTDPNNPPTGKQLYYLKQNDLPIPEKITFEQASEIIGKHKEKTE